MKKYIIGAVIFFSLHSSAQVRQVNLQASGLTCSLCSNAILKALKKLDFISTVKVDIKNSGFEIKFTEGKPVDFSEIKKAVEDAGFAVAKFSALWHVVQLTVNKDSLVLFEGMYFHFPEIKSTILNGDITVHVLDKDFLTAKEYRKNSTLYKSSCLQTGNQVRCFLLRANEAGRRVYHVKIL